MELIFTGEHFKLLIERYGKGWLPSISKRYGLKGELSLPIDARGVEIRIDGKWYGRLEPQDAQALRQDGRFDVYELEEEIIRRLPRQMIFQ